jgi:hypothetical protein
MKLHLIACLGLALATSVGAAASFGAERRVGEGPVAPVGVARAGLEISPFVAPNQFELAGENGVHVTYEVFGDDAIVLYHDASDAWAFFGNEVQTHETASATLVTVELTENDFGTLRLTLLIPSVAVKMRGSMPVQTLAVTAFHIAPKWARDAGQHDYYNTLVLNGTAHDTF